jgi:hypothetical protein
VQPGIARPETQPEALGGSCFSAPLLRLRWKVVTEEPVREVA